MTAIRAISYKEARLDHFKETRERRKKTLHWWKYQKPGKQYGEQTIHGMWYFHQCSVFFRFSLVALK